MSPFRLLVFIFFLKIPRARLSSKSGLFSQFSQPTEHTHLQQYPQALPEETELAQTLSLGGSYVPWEHRENLYGINTHIDTYEEFSYLSRSFFNLLV